MNSIRILVGSGHELGVDGFYERNGGRACARPTDLFFVAMLEDLTVACVRYCVENTTPMLRTMLVDANYRRRGVGSGLLRAFVEYLDANSICGVYCLPYSHLDLFYGAVGFVRIAAADVPLFLSERMQSYHSRGTDVICMRRP